MKKEEFSIFIHYTGGKNFSWQNACLSNIFQSPINRNYLPEKSLNVLSNSLILLMGKLKCRPDNFHPDLNSNWIQETQSILSEKYSFCNIIAHSTSVFFPPCLFHITIYIFVHVYRCIYIYNWYCTCYIYKWCVCDCRECVRDKDRKKKQFPFLWEVVHSYPKA